MLNKIRKTLDKTDSTDNILSETKITVVDNAKSSNNVSESINGKSLSSIFESDGVTVKNSSTSYSCSGLSSRAKVLSSTTRTFISGTTNSNGDWESSSRFGLSDGTYIMKLTLNSWSSVSYSGVISMSGAYGTSGYSSGFITDEGSTSTLIKRLFFVHVFSSPSDGSNNGGINLISYSGVGIGNQYFQIEFIKVAESY